MNNDYLIEKHLKQLNPFYSELISNTTFVLMNILEKYKNTFSDFTDHSITHSLNVLDFVNQLVGLDNIDKLNANELYILMMGAYLHDTGMGITEKDFEEACLNNVIPKEYIELNKDIPFEKKIRKFHHELSAFFVDKYQLLFDIPSKEHVFAVKAVSRGHRITDLYNNDEFPNELKLSNGNTVCVPYIAILIRLADEMDIAIDRMFKFEYDFEATIYLRCHQAIKKLEITDDSLIYSIDCEDEELKEFVLNTIDKLRDTFNDCKKAIEDLTPYKLKQNKVLVKDLKNNNIMEQ